MPVYSYSHPDEITKIESISGILIKTDKVKRLVVIKSNSRFVRFHTTPEICNEFKNKINSMVNLTFTRKNGKGLQLIKIRIISLN